MQQESDKINEFQPPADLFAKVMACIAAERKRLTMRRKFLIGLVCFAATFTVGIPVWQSFRSEIAQSGFVEYATLFFYDFKTVANSWQDFSLSLLESLPVVTTVEFLLVVLASLFSLKSMSKYRGSVARLQLR